MINAFLRTFGLIVFFFCAGSVSAQELLPPDRPIEDVIDHYISAKLRQMDIKPAPPADDATFLRRLTLDLVGRIPTTSEARDYLTSEVRAKRTKLIDRLITSPEYTRHGATEFDALLAGDNDKAPTVRPYLLAALKENRSWDQMFRELIGVQPAAHRPENFVLGRLNDSDDLTRDVSSVFFGLNITCAQCHRHPYVKSITQAYFYGMKLFFAQSMNFNGQLSERRYAQMDYKDKRGEFHKAKLIFLSGTIIEEPMPDVPDLAKAIQAENTKLDAMRRTSAKTKELPAKPAFSYREKLAEIALSPAERDRFARALVNRLWHRFYGYGFVMRLDQMHAENPPSHPELLDWLARDFIEHNYDLKRLIRGLVSSAAYARSSRWDGPGDAPSADLFAVAQVRLLTPMQYGLSQLLIADPGPFPAADSADFDPQYEKLETHVSKIFGKLIERPRDGLQINPAEALLLSNDVSLLKIQGDKLIDRLVSLEDRRKQIDAAVWAVLSRAPTAEEVSLLTEYLAQEEARLPDLTAEERQQRRDKRALIEKAKARVGQITKELAQPKISKDKALRDMLQTELTELRKIADQPLPIVSPFDSRRAQALHQMVWALLNSPEFRFNY